MINVDRVYQTVNALLNKNGGDWLTPQEFNLMATKAQVDVFEGEFYDLKNALAQGLGIGSDWGDIADNIRDKIQIFETQSSLVENSTESGLYDFPEDYYRLTALYWYDNLNSFPRLVEEVKHSRVPYLLRSPLTSPTVTSPVYAWSDNRVAVYPATTSDITIAASYIRRPIDPVWASVLVGDRVMYDENTSVNFEVHYSNLPELVVHILSYAGVVLTRPQVVQFAQGEDAQIQQSEQ